MKLFVSYAQEDKPICEAIVKRLRNRDRHQVWYNQPLRSGQAWRETIPERLIWSDGAVFLLSPDALESENCQNEVKLALKLKKAIFLVIIRKEKGADLNLPESITDLPLFDLIESRGKLKSLFDALAVWEQENLQDGGLSTESKQKAAAQDRAAPPVADEPPSPEIEHVRKLAAIFDDFFGDAQYKIFFSNLSAHEAPPRRFSDRWQEISLSDICLFDITAEWREVYIDLGIALSLGKYMLVTSQSPLPALLDKHNVLNYSDYDDLTRKLPALIARNELSQKLKIVGSCYFCDMPKCKVDFHEHVPQNYLVVTDRMLSWRHLRIEVEQYMEREISVPPVYSPDAPNDLCALRETVRKSHFVVAHLDYLSVPKNLITLGIALGRLVPWFLLYEDSSLMPRTLVESDPIEVPDDQFKSSQKNALNRFLAGVFPDTIKREAQDTARSLQWEELRSLNVRRTFQRQLTPGEPILGAIQIFRYSGSKYGAPYTLPPREQVLMFGRNTDGSFIQLEGETASREHFKIFKDSKDGRYYVDDLGSSNGTFLNGNRVYKGRPEEIFHRDTLRAGSSSFLIWDDNSEEEIVRVLKKTTELSKNMVLIELETELPNGLDTIHHERVLVAEYASPDPSMNVRFPPKQFRIQAYDPLGEVLPVLALALRLPNMQHYFVLNDKRLGPDETLFDLDIQDGTRILIVPNRVEWAAQQARDAIDHCENELTVDQHGVRYRVGFNEKDYIPFKTLFEKTYRAIYGGTPPSGPVPAVDCPNRDCPGRIGQSTKVAPKKST